VRLVQSRRPLRLAETNLTDVRTSARALQALIALTDREHFAALFVNGHHQVTGAHIVAIGAQHAIASIDIRAVFHAALAACASAIVLGHNHPSGDPTPSPQDVATTGHIVRAAKILCMPVLDHLIVTQPVRLPLDVRARDAARRRGVNTGAAGAVPPAASNRDAAVLRGRTARFSCRDHGIGTAGRRPPTAFRLGTRGEALGAVF
jgi:DNA repair protein RadC